MEEKEKIEQGGRGKEEEGGEIGKELVEKESK